MSKSEDVIKRLSLEELKILLMVIDRPNIVEAMRIYHVCPNHNKKPFFNAINQQKEIMGVD